MKHKREIQPNMDNDAQPAASWLQSDNCSIFISDC